MQNVQRWSQPFCTCTNTRGRPRWKPSTRCGAISFTDMMSVTAILSPATSASNAARASRQAAPRILSSLPTTRSTSAMSANIFAWVCAAQPVTTMRASGRSRFSRRIDCRACATASLVTAQLLMTMVSDRPALVGFAPDHFGFECVQPAAESDDLDGHVRRRWRTAPDRTCLRIRTRPCRSSARDRRAHAIRFGGRRPAA